MTRYSRILTIFVTVVAVAFMGATLVTTATWTDWKEVATKRFPKSEISSQQQKIHELDEQIADVDARQKLAEASIKADEDAIANPNTGREVQLEQQLAELIQQGTELARQVEAQARKTDARLDELKLRREDTVRLQNQFDELVSQKVAAEAEVKRLRDLLFQARGMLDRVQRRHKSLEEQMGKESLSDALPSNPDRPEKS